MKTPLLIEALTKYLAGVVLSGAMLFLPAGTWHYMEGWLFMVLLFAPMLIVGVVIAIKSPDLLRIRLEAKESKRSQDIIVKLSGLIFIASFVVAGLNHRYGWVTPPTWSVWLSSAIFLCSYLLYAEVLRENRYLSRTIKVVEGQTVVDTGLYGIVRHPMYMATTLLFLAMPMVLASPISLAIMFLYIPLIAKRIKTEESLLEEQLPGYIEYKKRVRYRMIPFIY